jgi:hypothetical protein
MLQIVIPATEGWDEEKQEFVTLEKEQTLQLEHSLVSISKWESKWCKSFLHTKVKTEEEVLDYIKCMTLTQNVKPETYNRLTAENINQINEYIEAPMTATYFSEEKGGKANRECVTSELIYYWMIALNIPIKFEKWHLNRLLTQIRVCNIKNQPPKKMSRAEIMARNAELNAKRKQQFNSKG